jgi:hypothetical protein
MTLRITILSITTLSLRTLSITLKYQYSVKQYTMLSVSI